MLDEETGTATVIDFGICAETIDGKTVLTTIGEAFGNRSYAAPECEAGSESRAGTASDIYSLGKLLYWMTADRNFMAREKFDASKISAASVHERRSISQLISRTVIEDPQSRWSADELLAGIDWAINKGDEHRAIRPLLVLHDSFGVMRTFNNTGSRSTTTPPRGNPPAANIVAQEFSTGARAVNLSRVELALSRRSENGVVRIELCPSVGGEPGPPIASWSHAVTTTTADSSAVTVLRPIESIALHSDADYWIVVSAVYADTDVPWWSGDPMLVGWQTRIGERNGQSEWWTASSSGPGFALLIIGESEADGGPP